MTTEQILRFAIAKYIQQLAEELECLDEDIVIQVETIGDELYFQVYDIHFNLLEQYPVQ
jgi:hypothetical protein